MRPQEPWTHGHHPPAQLPYVALASVLDSYSPETALAAAVGYLEHMGYSVTPPAAPPKEEPTP
jgi:hypothetical protein